MSTVDPVGDLVNQVLERDAMPLPPRSTPQAMDPVRQVAPMSYIGQALGRLGSKRNLKKSSKKKSKSRKRGKRTSRDPDDDSGDSSDSSSSPSDSDTTDSASESTESTESSESSDSSSDGPKRSKRSCHKKKRDQKKNTLKPIPPVTYDGSPDLRSFHQFLTEGTAYVKDGKVERRKRVFILAHYLKGRAREFYTREVSGDPYRWRLKDFFTELFNYCHQLQDEAARKAEPLLSE